MERWDGEARQPRAPSLVQQASAGPEASPLEKRLPARGAAGPQPALPVPPG